MKRQKEISGKEKIGRTVLQLLNRKSMKQITVAEVCRTAKINRSTFYYYYDNINDVLKDIVLAISFSSKNFFYAFKENNNCNFLDLSNDEQEKVLLQEFWPENLRRIKENKEIYKIIMNNSSLFDFQKENKLIYSYFFEKILNEIEIEEDKKEVVFLFYFSGELSIIYRWILTGCKEPIDKIIDNIYYAEHITFDLLRKRGNE